jgi:hypothetical protein
MDPAGTRVIRFAPAPGAAAAGRMGAALREGPVGGVRAGGAGARTSGVAGAITGLRGGGAGGGSSGGGGAGGT